MHVCSFCQKEIECEVDKNTFLICECEKIFNTENKTKRRYFFCKSAIFPSCQESWLIKKYDVSYIKLMTLHRKI